MNRRLDRHTDVCSNAGTTDSNLAGLIVPDIERLKVSLTKNGFFKVSDVIRLHPTNEILDNVDGVYEGINISRQQAGDILTRSASGNPLALWDTVRGLGDESIDAMVVLAIIFSHHRLIHFFADAAENGTYSLNRSDLTVKPYTNLLHSLKTAGYAPNMPRGSESFTYDLSPVFALPIAQVAKKLLKAKLRLTGWTGAPGAVSDEDFFTQAIDFRFHRVVGLTEEQFRTWLQGGEVIQDGLLPEEVRVPDNFYEGATRKVSVNVYERNPAARKACLEHYGYTCQVCGFDFEATYGELGQDFIHVHHLTLIATIQKTYQVNPIDDLRPVCPNCHAMIHKKNPPYTIAEMQAIIEQAEAAQQ
jgi:hypothetical protein